METATITSDILDSSVLTHVLIMIHLNNLGVPSADLQSSFFVQVFPIFSLVKPGLLGLPRILTPSFPESPPRSLWYPHLCMAAWKIFQAVMLRHWKLSTHLVFSSSISQIVFLYFVLYFSFLRSGGEYILSLYFVSARIGGQNTFLMWTHKWLLNTVMWNRSETWFLFILL